MKYFINVVSTFVVTVLLLISVPSLSVSANILENESILKQKTSYATNLQNVNPLSEIELKTLNEQYENNLIKEDEIDNKVGNILVKYTKNAKLQSKAKSFERNNKVEAMYAITKLLEAPKRLESNEKNVLIYFLSKYAPYTNDKELIQKTYQISNQQYTDAVTTNLTAVYDRTSASNYALQYALSYNTSSYPNLTSIGGDCTNFISQAMKAGGKPFSDNWYIYKKNSTYPKPTSISQLNNSWSLADPSPWISAKEFENYWANKLPDEILTASYVTNNQTAIYNKSYYRGDVIQILKSRYWWYEAYHTMMITGYGDKDYLMSYHTVNTKNKALHGIAVSYNSSSYKFRFFSVN